MQKNWANQAYAKSNSIKNQKFSPFQQRSFMSYLHEIFKYILCYYFERSRRCNFSKIKKRYLSVLLHFLVGKVERNNTFCKNYNVIEI